MNAHSKLRIVLLVLATLPLASMACDDEIVDPETDAEESRMVLRPNRVTLEPGQIFKLKAVFLRGTNEDFLYDMELEWNSSDPAVVRALGEGLIEAQDMGTATIQVDYHQWTAKAIVKIAHPRALLIERER